MDSVTFEFTPKLYRRIMISHAPHQYKTILVIIGICAIAVLGLSVFGYVVTGTNAVLEAWFPFLICLVAWVFFLVFWCPYSVSKNKLNRNQYQKVTLSIDDNRLIVELEDGLREAIPIKRFVKARITDNYTILWKNFIDVVIVPKNAFVTAEAYNNFVQKIVPQLEI